MSYLPLVCVGFSDNFLTDPGCVGCSDKKFLCVLLTLNVWSFQNVCICLTGPDICGVFRCLCLSYSPLFCEGFSDTRVCLTRPCFVWGFQMFVFVVDIQRWKKSTVLDCFSLPGNWTIVRQMCSRECRCMDVKINIVLSSRQRCG